MSSSVSFTGVGRICTVPDDDMITLVLTFSEVCNQTWLSVPVKHVWWEAFVEVKVKSLASLSESVSMHCWQRCYCSLSQHFYKVSPTLNARFGHTLNDSWRLISSHSHSCPRLSCWRVITRLLCYRLFRCLVLAPLCWMLYLLLEYISKLHRRRKDDEPQGWGGIRGGLALRKFVFAQVSHPRRQLG